MAREVISELEKGEKNNALIDESVELNSTEKYISMERLESQGHYEEEGEVFIMDSSRPSFIIWNSIAGQVVKLGAMAKSNCRY
jgi:hypothetical protein